MRKSCKEHTQNTKTNRVEWTRNCTSSVVALQDHCSYKATATNYHIKKNSEIPRSTFLEWDAAKSFENVKEKSWSNRRNKTPHFSTACHCCTMKKMNHHRWFMILLKFVKESSHCTLKRLHFFVQAMVVYSSKTLALPANFIAQRLSI